MLCEKQVDVVIVGGGMIGGALASALIDQDFDVVVLEREAPPAFDPESEPDVRISAISCASVDVLKEIKVWPLINQMRSAVYRKLETWEQGSTKVSFDAESLRLPELGYMIENQVLQRALWQRLQQQKATLACPASLQALEKSDDGWRVSTSQGDCFNTRLVVGADGANSVVRQMAGIGISGWSYSQDCLLISGKCAQQAGDVTWQQFMPEGPRAFLPLFDQWACLVWYDHPARIRQLKAMSMAQLAAEIAQHFPQRLVGFTPHRAASFPLVRRHATRYVLPGLVLVGDAAHTINPLAGQGANLGYRDVSALTKILVSARHQSEDWASEQVLRRYQKARRTDNHLMQGAMDLFHFAFSRHSRPLKLLRHAGLMAAQHSGALKNRVLRYALGL